MVDPLVHLESLKFKEGNAYEYRRIPLDKYKPSLEINKVNIYDELRAAFVNYHGKDYEAFGRDVGVLLAHIYIGANDVALLHPEATETALE